MTNRTANTNTAHPIYMKRKNSESAVYPEFEQLNMPAIEKEILQWWKENKVFERSVNERPEANRFVFYEGPPSANGKPGIHHVMSRTIKDLFCRFKTLQGYRVERKAGWDTHGLPIELNVEKTLGITKADIGTKITVAEYNKLCREDVMRYTDVWNNLTEKMGYWVDLDNPYITYENNYIETLWAILKMLFDKGLLYEGYTIQPYSPAAGTGLSSHELNQPGCYRNVKDVSAIAQFKSQDARIKSQDIDAVYFLAWTTTPWTLPSNTALAVGKDIEYVLVKTFNQFTHELVHVILANDLVGKYFTAENAELKFEDYNKGDKKIPFAVLKSFKGSELEGIRYEQLLPYTQPKDGDAFRVVLGDFVTTTDGTGIVHIAPSFGADDFKVAKQNGIGSLTLVDRSGKFVDEVNDEVFPLQGRYVKEAYLTDAEKEQEFRLQHEILHVNKIIDNLKSYMTADDLIVLKLKLENKLFRTEKYEHNYPHCWRTDKPIIYYPLDSWFIKTTAIKDKLIALNKTINWKPAHTGEGRFGQWLENLVDWNLSRSRYWGTPLPIWTTEDGSEIKCIGSIDELQKEISKSALAGLMKDTTVPDLHKPFVDEIVLVSDSGKPMHRVPDLIDVWFDSGAMPYAQYHWPFENQDKVGTLDANGNLVPGPFFPAGFIAEGVDQTRGWFFTLHVLATALTDGKFPAYKTVVSNGLLLDKNGNKMSKRLGNVIDPFETLEKHSADATRWYMMRNSDPWDNMKFDIAGLQEVQRSHFGTLYNTYGFFALYANIDKWSIDKNNLVPVEKRQELDRWILSKLQSLIKEVTAQYEDYEPTKAARAIEQFVDEDLSNWYVRLNRRRFWKGEMSEDKKAAYETLHDCLNVVAQLMAPIAPFFSDWLFANLNGKQDSIHLSHLVKANVSLIDEDLEKKYDLARKICSLGLSIRKAQKIKVRQPLKELLISASNTASDIVIDELFSNNETDFNKSFRETIKAEVNIKEFSITTNFEKKVSPDFKNLGKKFGASTQLVANALKSLKDQVIIAEIENHRGGMVPFFVDGVMYELEPSDFTIQAEDIPGYKTASDDGLTVALDVTITDDLRKEGNAREFINKVQNLRKDKDFQVLDRIKVSVVKNAIFEEALLQFKDYIGSEILAKDISVVETLDVADEIEMNDELLKVKVEVIS